MSPDEPPDKTKPNEKNKENDSMFQYILARSRTRETSILAVATIASSASLILLGLFIQIQIEVTGCYGECGSQCDNECYDKCDECYNKCLNECDIECPLLDCYEDWIKVVAILFAALGIIYREITAGFIHRNDEVWLHAYVKKFRKDDAKDLQNDKGDKIPDPLFYHKDSLPRGIALRLLLSIPIVIWAYTINSLALGLAIAFTVSYVLVLSLCDSLFHKNGKDAPEK